MSFGDMVEVRDYASCADPAAAMREAAIARRRRLNGEPRVIAIRSISSAPEPIQIKNVALTRQWSTGPMYVSASSFIAAPSFTMPRAGKAVASDIIDLGCLIFEVSKNEILSRRRLIAIVNAKQSIYWACQRFTSLSYPELAKILQKDHSSIVHGVSVIRNFISCHGVSAEEDTALSWLTALKEAYHDR